MIIIGDCQEKLLELNENSIDTCITDPPYELGFMGKDWDSAGVSFQKETWEKVYRVLKPGGFLLAFGGTRTSHRIAVAIEDAGFEIRDTICWLYGSGFPKSYNVGKGMDKRRATNNIIRPWLKSLGSKEEIAKAAGVTQRQVDHWLGENTPCPQTLTEKRFILICEYFESIPEWSNKMYEKIGEKLGTIEHSRSGGKDFAKIPGSASNKRIEIVTSSATPEAEVWEGWGTALKPAFEPIIVAMKPIDGTYVENALKHGVSGLWIDGGRINPDEKYLNGYSSRETKVQGQVYGWAKSEKYVRCAPNDSGRWPANVILDETSAEMLDEQTGNLGKSQGGKSGHLEAYGGGYIQEYYGNKTPGFGDSGGASRFFYCAKASRKERNMGLEGMPEKVANPNYGKGGFKRPTDEPDRQPSPAANHHPTVKPLALMQYLVRLTKTPTGGIVLDPFMGSGTTGIACVLENRDFIGIEMNEEYAKIAKLRIEASRKLQPQLKMNI